MGAIELRDVRKEFDGVKAVNDISLSVTDGEFIVLVGPSGCGKSTTLRLIAGLTSVSSGTISIDGTVVNEVEPKDRDVAMVFQNYALYPHMTARQNITFGMKSATSLTAEEIEKQVENAAEILDISDLLDRRPDALSGGEQQRVAIGRTIARDPEVFLMDEPLSNLDAKLRIKMRAELQELHDELQTTTVYVTHDQTEAMTLGDRVIVMAEGKIQQIDPAQTVYDYPNNRFVAEFIGSPSMNVFPVTLRRDGDAVLAETDELSFVLPTEHEHEHDLTDGLTCDFGIRPEDFKIVESDAVDADRTLTFEVSIIDTLGDSLLLYGTAGGIDLQVIGDDPRTDVSKRDVLTLTYDPDRLHLFDAETGDAIYHSDKRIQKKVVDVQNTSI